MDNNRRDFLKIAGLTAVGLGAGSLALEVITKDDLFAAVESLPGKRWAMVIDAQRCLQQKGCRKCMDKCHEVHNVPLLKSKKHEIKWIWKEKFEHAFPEQAPGHYLQYKYQYKYEAEPMVVLCNHCNNPPCVRVCPTQATWKRKSDGIVMMDFHRCIGCRYCIAACPYGSRSFNFRDPMDTNYATYRMVYNGFPRRCKGVVEKCNFCAERLARNLRPACVDACTEKALLFGDLKVEGSEVRAALERAYSIRRKPALGTEPQVYYIV